MLCCQSPRVLHGLMDGAQMRERSAQLWTVRAGVSGAMEKFFFQ